MLSHGERTTLHGDEIEPPDYGSDKIHPRNAARPEPCHSHRDGTANGRCRCGAGLFSAFALSLKLMNKAE
jgi:hypothetical protein